MDIKNFIANFHNHPVLFIGSGFSFRYLENTYTWNALLSKICEDLWGNDEKYLDIKAKYTESNGYCPFDKVATMIEEEFNVALERDRNGKFSEINDTFYEYMRKGVTLSRFKIYIAKLVGDLTLKDGVEEELNELKRARKNIGSIITTNYDQLIEKIFEFHPLVGNDILLSNPYGSIYKIHGCVTDISKIIITTNDYKKFDEQYELIRAQMLSIFIHNPIIFLGYGIGDENIQKVLKTIFSYIPLNTPDADKIRQNFLLVEYEAGSTNHEITDHDIVVKGSNIRINKLRTDDYSELYRNLANINLPISAMDVRKVQSVVKEIYAGGSIKVMITENIDDLKNSDRILAIGSDRTLKYQYLTIPEMVQNYFSILEEANSSLISLINKQTISDSQYFPIYGFAKICQQIDNVEHLKSIQTKNLEKFVQEKCNVRRHRHTSIADIEQDVSIAESYKHPAIMYGVNTGHISLEDVEKFLKNYPSDMRKKSDYRRLLCLYDKRKYQ